MEENKKIIIIDGDSFIHRAYHGYKKDENKDAIMGFLSMITKIINNNKFDYIAIVLDDQNENFRHRLSPKYKANRPPKPIALQQQIYDIHSFIKNSGLPYFSVVDVEGDDVIGFLAKKAQNKNWSVDIFSGDKDLAQVIDEKTKIIDTRFKKEIELKNIFDNFGVVHPYQIVDLLALQGDKADNIEGINKCGKTTAIKIIKEFGTIENLLNTDHQELIEKMKPLIRNKESLKIILDQIMNEKEKILLSKNLISLKTDLDLDLKIKDIKIKTERIKKEVLIQICQKYGLNIKYSLPRIIIG